MTILDMMKQKGIRIVNEEKKGGGSKAATSTTKKFVFSAPKVPKITDILQDPSERQKAMDEFATFKADVNEQMPAMIRQMRAIETMSDQERPLYAEAHKELQGAVAEMLSYGSAAARNVSVVAYAKAIVETCPEFRGSVEWTLGQLEAVGLLKTVQNTAGAVRKGEVRVYSSVYALTEDFSRSPEGHEILDQISQLVRRTVDAGKTRFEESLKALQSEVGENPLTIAELKAGAQGRILLEVPDTTLPDGKFLRGGKLLVECHENRISVLGAVGFIQRIAEEMIQVGTFVYADQIGADRLTITAKLPEDLFRKALQLFRWLNLAVDHAEKKAAAELAEAKWSAQVTAERDALRPQANLTYEEFFLGGKTGVVFYDFGDRVFQFRTKSTTGQLTTTDIPNVCALIERNDKGEIRVVNCPSRLDTFFAGFRQAQEPGEKFFQLGVLGVLLRMGFAEAVSASYKTKKEQDPEEESSADAITAELATVVGVDPSTLGQEDETLEDREARKRANKITPKVAVPKHGNRRPRHAQLVAQ